MSNKPIFVATHPRACSTAFERVFMTRRESLQCVHEPFGDAFYYGPERLSTRYENDMQAREDIGFSQSTYQTIFDRFEREASEGKRLFIKDMAYYLFPPEGNSPSVAPSLGRVKRGVGTSASVVNGATNGTTKAPYPYHTDAEPNNPTVIPRDTLGKFHFTFLIRHPRSSIPSYYRCTVPPLDEVTGFYDFMPSEAGYEELRRLFDYLRSIGQTGPKIAGQSSDDHATTNGTTDGITNGATNGTSNENINGTSNGIAKGPASGTANGIAHGFMSGKTNGTTNGIKEEVEVCVVDADDLLDHPQGIIEAYCNSVGIDYAPDMLTWDTEEDGRQAKDAFEKWPGFHDDAMNSTDLKPRLHKKKVKTARDEDAEWAEKFGEKGAKVIRETVDASMEDYEYLKQFAIKV